MSILGKRKREPHHLHQDEQPSATVTPITGKKMQQVEQTTPTANPKSSDGEETTISETTIYEPRKKREPGTVAAGLPSKRRRSRFCQYEGGCPRQVRHGKGGALNRCIRHGGGKRCSIVGCQFGARRNSTFCTGHGGQTCRFPGCRRQFRDSVTGCCMQHGGFRKTCQAEEGCPHFVQGASDACIAHGGGYRCQGCGLFGSSRKNYTCHYCDKGSSRCQKEAKVVKFLEENCTLKTISSHDQIVGGNLCLKYRPDIFYDCLSYGVVVEVDEDAHRSYDARCEQHRMQTLAISLDMPLVFLRYNPDPFKRSGVTVITPQLKRLATLLERLNFHLSNHPKDGETVIVEYLFYDEENPE